MDHLERRSAVEHRSDALGQLVEPIREADVGDGIASLPDKVEVPDGAANVGKAGGDRGIDCRLSGVQRRLDRARQRADAHLDAPDCAWAVGALEHRPERRHLVPEGLEPGGVGQALRQGVEALCDAGLAGAGVGNGAERRHLAADAVGERRGGRPSDPHAFTGGGSAIPCLAGARRLARRPIGAGRLRRFRSPRQEGVETVAQLIESGFGLGRRSDPLGHRGDPLVEGAYGLADRIGRRAVRCPGRTKAQAPGSRPRPRAGLVEVAVELGEHCRDVLERIRAALAAGSGLVDPLGTALDLVDPLPEPGNRRTGIGVHCPDAPGEAGDQVRHTAQVVVFVRRGTAWRDALLGGPPGDGAIEPFAERKPRLARCLGGSVAEIVVDPLEAPRHAGFHRPSPRCRAVAAIDKAERPAKVAGGTGPIWESVPAPGMRGDFGQHGKQGVKRREDLANPARLA